MLLCLGLGGELVVVPDPRDTLHILEIIAHEKITVYPGVPALYIAIINHPRVAEFDLHSIRVCLSGGSSLPSRSRTEICCGDRWQADRRLWYV